MMRWFTARSLIGALLFTVAVWLAVGLDAQTARTLYVSPTGTDTNPGTETQPFRTIQHAADLVNPGDTVIVEDGVYTAAGTTACGAKPILCLTRGGTATAPVTIKARHPGGAKLDGQANARTDGITFLANANYLVVDGFELYGVGNISGSSSGIELYNGGHDVTLSHNVIHDIGRLCTDTTNGEVGIYVQQPRVRIEANTIHHIGRFGPGEHGCTPATTYYQTHDHGVYVNGGGGSVAGALILNNVFYSIPRGWAIQVYPGTVADLSILNNTFAFPNPNQDGQIIIGANTSGSRISNNVFYTPTRAALDYYQGSQTNLQVAGNLVFGGALFTSTPSGTTVSGTILADPHFVSVSTTTPDFHLTLGSPAIDTGVTLAEVTTDIDGVARPAGAFDIGAYEYAGAPPPPPPPPSTTVATPTISPNGGVLTAPVSVTLASTTAGAIIRYTATGEVPAATSPVYSMPFVVSVPLTVQAYATATGMTDSAMAIAAFTAAPPPPPPADTTPPTVAFTSPLDGTVITPNTTLAFTVATADNVAVVSVRFNLDGVDLGTDTTVPFSVSRKFRRSAVGTHVMTAVAKDGAGNAGTASVTMTVRR